TKRLLDIGDGSCQKRTQFCQCEFRIVGLLDAGRAREPLDFRGKRRVDVERRTLQRQNITWRRIKGTAELADQTRLADAGFTGNKAHRPHTSRTLLAPLSKTAPSAGPP